MSGESRKIDASRRHMSTADTSLAVLGATGFGPIVQRAQARTPAPAAGGKTPNILVIFGDDIGLWSPSARNKGPMGFKTPNIDRIANEGALMSQYYGLQSCTAGRAAFITGQCPFRQRPASFSIDQVMDKVKTKTSMKAR